MLFAAKRGIIMDQAAGPPQRSGLIILICLFIAALEGYDIQAFGVAAPRLVKELGLAPEQQGWAAAAAMIGMLLGAFIGGWAADRVGRRPVLVASIAAFGVFSLATAFSHDYPALMLARLATGLGFGGVMANLVTLATEISPPGRRTATTTMMFCGFPAGGVLVALIARLGGEALDWRVLFIIGGVIPVVLAPVVYFLLPETRPQAAPDADRRSVAALFGGGRAAATLLIWTASLLLTLVLNLLLNWLPTLVTAKGLTAGDGATAALAFNLSGVIGALIAGILVDRFGARWTLTLFFAVMAGALYVLASAAGLTPTLAYAGLAGFMVMGAQFSLYGQAPALYPPQVRAVGAGGTIGVGRVGAIIGPLVAGELRQAGFSGAQVFQTLIPVVIVAGLASLALSYVGRPSEA
jgi:MFS transporter, AAHS family, 3-hydroxyphenylpropionic acid transporter